MKMKFTASSPMSIKDLSISHPRTLFTVT